MIDWPTVSIFCILQFKSNLSFNTFTKISISSNVKLLVAILIP